MKTILDKLQKERIFSFKFNFDFFRRATGQGTIHSGDKTTIELNFDKINSIYKFRKQKIFVLRALQK